MTEAFTHMNKNPRSAARRPLCDAPHVQLQTVTIYPQAVTCPECKRRMRK